MYECVRFTAINWECFRHKGIFVSSSINGCTYNHQLLEKRPISHQQHNSYDENRSWVSVHCNWNPSPGFCFKNSRKNCFVLSKDIQLKCSGIAKRDFLVVDAYRHFWYQIQFFQYFFFNYVVDVPIYECMCALDILTEKKPTNIGVNFHESNEKGKNNDYGKFDTHVNAIVHVKTLHQIPNRTPKKWCIESIANIW